MWETLSVRDPRTPGLPIRAWQAAIEALTAACVNGTLSLRKTELRHSTAVDGPHLTGHERRFIRCQPGHQTRDLFGLSGASHWMNFADIRRKPLPDRACFR